MILRVRIGRWRFTFTFAPVTNVIGVNSNLPDGNHILMWDFDDVPFEYVEQELLDVQWHYGLPKIRILKTGKGNHYIAYCFKRLPWRKSVEIIAATPDVDPNFFKYGVYREHWTLRVSPKECRIIKLVAVLKGDAPEDASIKELRSWTKYETISDTLKPKKVELNIGKRS